jgi:hypothetical protein
MVDFLGWFFVFPAWLGLVCRCRCTGSWLSSGWTCCSSDEARLSRDTSRDIFPRAQCTGSGRGELGLNTGVTGRCVATARLLSAEDSRNGLSGRRSGVFMRGEVDTAGTAASLTRCRGESSLRALLARSGGDCALVSSPFLAVSLSGGWKLLTRALRLANGSMIARSFHLFDAGGDQPPLLVLSSSCGLEVFFQERKNWPRTGDRCCGALPSRWLVSLPLPLVGSSSSSRDAAFVVASIEDRAPEPGLSSVFVLVSWLGLGPLGDGSSGSTWWFSCSSRGSLLSWCCWCSSALTILAGSCFMAVKYGRGFRHPPGGGTLGCRPRSCSTPSSRLSARVIVDWCELPAHGGSDGSGGGARLSGTCQLRLWSRLPLTLLARADADTVWPERVKSPSCWCSCRSELRLSMT